MKIGNKMAAVWQNWILEENDIHKSAILFLIFMFYISNCRELSSL